MDAPASSHRVGHRVEVPEKNARQSQAFLFLLDAIRCLLAAFLAM
jgi:hypothetical protein